MIHESRPPGKHASEIILDHFKAAYKPAYRHGTSIYSSALRRKVAREEACCGAETVLIKALAAASNAKRVPVNIIDEDALPRLFRTWAPTAWKDLLNSLPDERTYYGKEASK